MAEINWGQMSPIQPPSVVAQLPQQPNQMDQFAGGLLSGIQQGQQIQSNNLALGKQRQEIADNEALRKAAAEGGDKWMQTLISQGKVDDAMQYQVHQQQYQNAILQNKASIIDLDIKERAKADRDNSINVAIMGAVSQLPPEQREAEFQKYKTDMQAKYPGLVMPDKFNADSMASVMRVNEVIQSQQTAEATEKVKTLTQLQNQRDILAKAKQVAIQAGKPTEEIDRKLQETQDLINTHTKNVQTQSTSGMVDKGLVELDLGDVKDSRDKAADSSAAIEQYQTFKKLNQNFKTGMFAETGLNIKKAYQTLTGQEFPSTKFGEAVLTKGMDFVFDRIQDTKGAISDKEMELFKATSAGMKNTKEGNDLILDIAMKVEQRKIDMADVKRAYLQENGSLKGFQSEWAKKIAADPIITDDMVGRFKDKKSTNTPKADPLGIRS